MVRWILGLSLAVIGAAHAQQVPPGRELSPPRDATVLRALPKLPPGLIRDDVTIVKERIAADTWQCSVSCREKRLILPGLAIPVGKIRSTSVQIQLVPVEA
jgi:hypothetical protein